MFPMTTFPSSDLICWNIMLQICMLLCTFEQGRLVHKGDWGDALPREKKTKKKNLLMYKRNIPVSRVNLNLIIFFLSDSTTRPSDLPLYVIVESGNSRSVSLKSCFKWPRPFWGDLGRNGNCPRPLSLTLMLNPFFFLTKQGSRCILYGFREGSPTHAFVIRNRTYKNRIRLRSRHILSRWLTFSATTRFAL